MTAAAPFATSLAERIATIATCRMTYRNRFQVAADNYRRQYPAPTGRQIAADIASARKAAGQSPEGRAA